MITRPPVKGDSLEYLKDTWEPFGTVSRVEGCWCYVLRHGRGSNGAPWEMSFVWQFGTMGTNTVFRIVGNLMDDPMF